MKLRVLLALGVLGLAACTPDWARQNESGLIMRISQMVGESGGTGGPESGSGFLFSDVVSDTGSIFNDNAVLTVELIRKNSVDNPDVGTVRSNFEDVTLTRYEVQFYRTDGRNQEGVDVPFRTTGALTILIPSPPGTTVSSADVPIVIVRHQAKMEAPLLQLKNLSVDSALIGSNMQISGAGILTCIARITVYGTTTNGRALSATGEMMVTFANFGG